MRGALVLPRVAPSPAIALRSGPACALQPSVPLPPSKPPAEQSRIVLVGVGRRLRRAARGTVNVLLSLVLALALSLPAPSASYAAQLQNPPAVSTEVSLPAISQFARTPTSALRRYGEAKCVNFVFFFCTTI